MKRNLLLLLCCCISISGAFAQVSVSGRITDHSGEGIPGVNVRVSKTTTGTMTDVSGAFKLENVQGGESAVLVFSFIGYITQETRVGQQRTFNMVLQEDNLELEEVTVVAFGTAKKRDLTGAISTVDSKTLSTQSNSTVTRALEGAVPGLQVASIDGQPGMDMGVRIRGLGSANSNSSNALIVIDGVPSTHDNVLATLNPKDIESVTVLKDGASTALYGSLGANGVLLITTKKGVKGKTKISYDGRFGVNQRGPGKYDKITDPKDVYEYAWLSIYNAARYKSTEKYSTNVANPNMSHDEAALFASQHLFDYSGDMGAYKRNALGNYMLYDLPGAIYTPSGSGADASSTMSGAYLVGLDGKLNPNARLLYHDPYDSFVDSKFRQEHNLSASGATDKTDYFVSIGYLQDPSYIPGSKFERYNVRGNLNAQLFDWLKTGFNAAYGNRKTQSPATRYGRNPGSAAQNIFRWIDGVNPLIPVMARDKNGIITGANSVSGKSWSPLGPTIGPYGNSDYDLGYILSHDKDIRTSHDINLRGYLEANFLKDFTFTANLSSDNYFEVRDMYVNGETGAAATNDGGFGQVYNNVYIINAQQLLKWNKEINRHHIDILLGHEFRWWKAQNISYKGSYSLIPDFAAYANFVGFNNGSTFPGAGGNMNKNALEGYFSRVNYIYNNKYYGEVSVRADGSSKFKKSENRWGVFWSVGAGWRISAEEWMSGAHSWLSDLKLRASYGVIGNQNGIGNYTGYQTWSLGTASRTYSGTAWSPNGYTLSQGAWANDALTWEKVGVIDAGIDFRLWNRVYGTLDYYQRNTMNAIWNEPIAYSLGQASLQRNNAELRNYGIEVSLGVDIIKTSDLSWSVSLNGTHYRTKVVSVPAGTGSEALGGNWVADTDGWSAAGTVSSQNGFYLRGVDKDYFNMYIYKYGGVDQHTGLPLFHATVTSEDHANKHFTEYAVGEEVTTTNYTLADRYEMGTATPDIIGGFSTSVSYKGWDLSAAFAFQLGGKFLSVQYANHLYRIESIGAQLSSEVLGNTWTPENTGAKFPMQMYTGDTYSGGSTLGSWMYTDLALFSASYLNVKNITLGYTLPPAIMYKIPAISSIRLYASIDNMWMFSQHSGLDPRMSLVGGMDVNAYTYPYMRTMSFGINLNF